MVRELLREKCLSGNREIKDYNNTMLKKMCLNARFLARIESNFRGPVQ
jgi:hypothetical protein